ncbi:MAG: helix-turn-helix transcriptional regulator [Pyrinomonadaceae bacterium]
MIDINLKRVMNLRGVRNPYKFLLDLGFAPATARHFLGFVVSRINFEHLERLCLALNCTPNDLLEWKPPENQANPNEQALIKLKRGDDEDLPKLLKTLPIDKFEQIVDILQDLNKKTDEAI